MKRIRSYQKCIVIAEFLAMIVMPAWALNVLAAGGEENARNEETLAAPAEKQYRISRKITREAKECIDCHAKESKGIVADWADSRHGHANVNCMDCHQAEVADAQFDGNRQTSIVVANRDFTCIRPGPGVGWNADAEPERLPVVGRDVERARRQKRIRPPADVTGPIRGG